MSDGGVGCEGRSTCGWQKSADPAGVDDRRGRRPLSWHYICSTAAAGGGVDRSSERARRRAAGRFFVRCKRWNPSVSRRVPRNGAGVYLTSCARQRKRIKTVPLSLVASSTIRLVGRRLLARLHLNPRTRCDHRLACQRVGCSLSRIPFQVEVVQIAGSEGGKHEDYISTSVPPCHSEPRALVTGR